MPGMTNPRILYNILLLLKSSNKGRIHRRETEENISLPEKVDLLLAKSKFEVQKVVGTPQKA